MAVITLLFRPSACCRQEQLTMAPNTATVVSQAMFLAAAEGDTHAVTAWLDEGGGVDTRCTELKDMTLLMAATAGGQEALVRVLLRRGASVNLLSSLGCTALMAAARGGQTTIVQALLDAKADTSPQDYLGWTALMLAEHHEHTATAQLLRQHAKRQTAEAEAAVMHAAATAPTPNLAGRRVRIFIPKPTPNAVPYPNPNPNPGPNSDPNPNP